uniref:Band 3 cytoplasmic domain-containing protein n=1 Tax=Panagrolaimus superbus TaxID=310955 RepID=A0A914YUA6_9BILA
MNELKSSPELEITDTEKADIWKKLTERRLSKIPAQSHALFFEEEVNDVPAAFCELDQYVITDKKENIGYWRESTRWVKFQEVLDEEGKRWSKPHLPVISANALFQLK